MNARQLQGPRVGMNLRYINAYIIQEEADERRRKNHIMELRRVKNKRLTAMEEEEAMKNEFFLQKATIQQRENEDEIKKLNEVSYISCLYIVAPEMHRYKKRF